MILENFIFTYQNMFAGEINNFSSGKSFFEKNEWNE